jgi:Raf kinase inhibitor-like YbhB/YbcL family protein
MAGIDLKSAAFTDHAFIPDRFAKRGGNVSPPLTWSQVPDGSTELVLLCEDPDAPTGTFLHWLVTGIDPSSPGVDAGEPPAGGTARPNGFGDRGWGGPHPPAGDEAHRYFFHLYAVSEPPELPGDATPEDVHRATERGRLASGTLVGRYQR